MSISFWPAMQQIAGGVSGSPASIIRDSQWTIVVVDTGAGSGTTNLYVELPANADIGDVVEVHHINGNDAVTSVPSGESITSGIPLPGNRFFRKIDTALWSYLV